MMEDKEKIFGIFGLIIFAIFVLGGIFCFIFNPPVSTSQNMVLIIAFIAFIMYILYQAIEPGEREKPESAIQESAPEQEIEPERKPVPENVAPKKTAPERKSITKDIRISYHRGSHYRISVHESFSLKFRGDVYNCSVLGDEIKEIKSELIERHKAPYKNVELLEDKYGRLWLYTCYWDFLAPSEMTYQLVSGEQDADALAASPYTNISDLDLWDEILYGSNARLPYFFASIYPDTEFCIDLHEDPTEETAGYIKSKRKEIIELNRQK